MRYFGGDRVVLRVFYVLAIVVGVAGSVAARDEIVNIGRHTIKLTSSTSCAPKKWDKNPTDSCDCCLIKHYLKGYSAGKNYHSCVFDKKYCKDDHPVLASADKKKYIDHLAQTSLVAKDLTLTKLHAKLTEQDAGRLVKEAGTRGFMKDLPKCVAKALPITSWFATQLFQIQTSSTCSAEDYQSKYILKGSRQAFQEIKNLEVIKRSPVANSHISGLVITKPEVFASYLVNKDRFYVTLLQAAKGKTVHDFVREAAKIIREKRNLDDEAVQKSFDVIRQAYTTFGRVLAEFHLAHKEPDCHSVLCKTVIHGDLHDDNVFFDPNDNVIYFIDNESMASSIGKRADPANDLTRVYYLSAAHVKPSSRFPAVIPEKVMAEIALEPFLRAYIGAYPSQAQKLVTEKLRNIMLSSASKILFFYKSGKYQVYNPFKLAQVQKFYVRPLFDRLLREG